MNTFVKIRCMPPMNKVLWIVCCLFLFACSEKKPSFYFEKVTPPQEDATKIWLRDNANYQSNKENYWKVFTAYYYDKIKKKDYLNACKILDVIISKFVYFYDFDPRLTALVNDFDQNYRSKIPAIRSTPIDNYFANLAYDQDHLQEACRYFQKITALEPIDYKSCYKIARAYYDLSYTYFILGDIPKSIEANEQSRYYSLRIRDEESIISVYLNYINIYKATGDFKKAVYSANQAIAVFKKNGNTYDYFMGKYDKISIYSFFNKTREKRRLVHELYQEYIRSGFQNDVLLLCISDLEVAALLEENELSAAEQVMHRIRPIAEKNTSQNWSNDYQATLALYLLKTDPEHCNTTYLENALPRLVAEGNYERANLFYQVLREKALKANDYTKALAYTEGLYRTKDSLSSAQTKLKNLELVAHFESKEKEQEIQLHKETISQKNTAIMALVFLFLALSLIGIVYYLQQKQKKILAAQVQSQQFTQKLLTKTEEERKRIASDLHDSVSHELLTLKRSLTDNHTVLNAKVDAIINDIRLISRNLHPVLFEKIGLKDSIEQFIERIQDTHNFLITSEIDYHNQLGRDRELQVYRIVQEAITNIIKYAQAVAAKITISESDTGITVIIVDNGIGFDVARTLQSKDAFGLHNIIERSKAIGGNATIQSTNTGTQITLEIPI